MTNDHGVPFASPFALPELVDGFYPTAAFLNDARRDAERRDRALLELVYEVGVEVLRADALDRVPEFNDAYKVAS